MFIQRLPQLAQGFILHVTTPRPHACVFRACHTSHRERTAIPQKHILVSGMGSSLNPSKDIGTGALTCASETSDGRSVYCSGSLSSHWSRILGY